MQHLSTSSTCQKSSSLLDVGHWALEFFHIRAVIWSYLRYWLKLASIMTGDEKSKLVKQGNKHLTLCPLLRPQASGAAIMPRCILLTFLRSMGCLCKSRMVLAVSKIKPHPSVPTGKVLLIVIRPSLHRYCPSGRTWPRMTASKALRTYIPIHSRAMAKRPRLCSSLARCTVKHV